MENCFNELLIWYDANARKLPWRETTDPYSIWISEVMLQQTRVEAVKGYYTRFTTELPDVESLANVSDEKLFKLWEGLGYYSRARNLKRAAQVILHDFGGRIPADYDFLLSLPGIGEYTAGAIASIAFQIPVPAVDGNVLRVFARLQNDARNILDPRVKAELRSQLLKTMPQDKPGTFNQAIMELGATVCLPNGAPQCRMCPMNNSCLAFSLGTAQELPVREKKKPRRVEEKTVFVIHMPEGIPIYQRPGEGLLAGLWQLPDMPGHLDTDAVATKLSALGIIPTGEWSVYERKHIFTHVEWRMRVISLSAPTGPLPEGWEFLSETNQALPTAYKKCIS